MKDAIVPVKNVRRLMDAGHALIQRAPGMPGMGLITARTGYGKTFAAAWFAVASEGYYVRAMRQTTPSSLLGSILREMQDEPKGSCADMVRRVVELAKKDPRPIFLDEADYLFDRPSLVDTMRDLHDLTTAPVILIGKDKLKARISRDEQLARRITQIVQFYPLDMEDARLLADGICELRIADDLLERIHDEAGGSIGYMTVGLGTVESDGRARGKKLMSGSDWPKDKPFFLAPVTGRGAK